MEASNKDGGLQLPNLRLFNAALKIGWLRRFLKSHSKWISVPIEFEFIDLFKFGIALSL